MSNIRKLPIGIQDFEKLRINNNAYVDKTMYIYALLQSDAPCFLVRPRRFGKSLFLSTLKAYFEGKRELFEGLAIVEFEKEWIEYPVFYIDFNIGIYTDTPSTHQTLNYNLRMFEEKWGKTPDDDNSEINDEVRTILKSFYGVLKSSDAYLRFVFLTGVAKFSKVSVFSDLNQLQDISMKEQYAGICGISQAELVGNFQPEIAALAEEQTLNRWVQG